MSAVGRFSVRWVYSKPVGGREGGQRPCLCFRGRKYAFCVASGHPVRVLRRPVELFDRYRELEVPAQGVVENGKGLEGARRYQVLDAVARLREIGGRNGITAAAAGLLGRAAAWQPGAEGGELDEESINDEEDVTMENVQKTESTGPAQAGGKAGKAARKPAKAAKVKAKGNGKARPAAKAKGDGLGRPGSLTRLINERLVRGQDNATISAAAKKAFPKSKSTKPSHVSWFRWKAKDLGLIK